MRTTGFGLLLTSAFALASCATAQSAAPASLVGAWKIVEYAQTEQDSGKVRFVNDRPSGHLIYSSDGHMAAWVTRNNRPDSGLVPSDAVRVEWQKAIIAGYSGRYTLKAGTVTHHIESAWNPAWVGTDQVRHYELTGDRLVIHTPAYRTSFDGKMIVSRLVFQRER
jgi:hypothetical protein